jgi:PRTRC genetic system protein A
MPELVESLLIDSRDKASFKACPILPVPRYGRLPDLEPGRVRYLVARDGLYIEARTPVIHACAQLAPVDQLPCGEVEPHFTLTHGGVPPGLLDDAVGLAREAAPNEWAGAIVVRDGRYELLCPTVHEALGSRIRYDAIDIAATPVVMDLHSHVDMAAFFSGTDDQDDSANPAVAFVAGVVGHIHEQAPIWRYRIVINGRAFDMSLLGGRRLITQPKEPRSC